MRFHSLALQYPNKHAVITGAGSGLGLALTQLLLADGWRIQGIDLQVDALIKIQNPLLNVHHLDITKTEAFSKLLTDILAQSDIDILFNNAGVGEGSLFQDYDLAHWDWIIAINLKAILVASHQVLPSFLKKNHGMIVNMASAAGYANLPKMSPYNVSKAAVISLSETMAHELSKTNVKVKCVTPTFFQSSIMQHSKGEKEILQSANKVITNSKLSSEDAAVILLSKLHKKQEVIRFPFSAKLFLYARYYLPGIYKWGVRRYLVK
jgi:short-subunit dehydrogenase